MAATSTPSARRSRTRRVSAKHNGAPAPTRLTPAERAEKGKALRSEVPRSSHADWQAKSWRPDPIELLEEQAASRVPDLVPIRYGRMVASPFAFFRGAAYPMASDLAHSPRTGIRVQLCGDAHLSNFGGFASPERDLVFDLNDFDETHPGPWEWDVKRLAASIEVAGRDNGYGRGRRRQIVRGAVGEYRRAMREFAAMSALDTWYARVDEQELLRRAGDESQIKRLDKVGAKARRKDSGRAFEKLAVHGDGGARIVADPPLIIPIRDLVGEVEADRFEADMRATLRSYRLSLPRDRRALLDRYGYEDLAQKVVGVGSVGTRAWAVLLLDHDSDGPLFLQAKEAGPSVLEPFAGKGRYDNQGRRVVEGQRLMQATSDIFLGWLRTIGLDGEERDFYIRQLWDWKISADIETMRPSTLADYTRVCGWTLARAHARSGDAIAIGSYLGSGESFDKALADFAEAYADQNEKDHRALVDAIDSGRVAAQTGL